MAIDSAEKRRNVANIPWWAAGVGVTPNAGKDAEWRAQAGWGYAGIPATGTQPSPGNGRPRIAGVLRGAGKLGKVGL